MIGFGVKNKHQLWGKSVGGKRKIESNGKSGGKERILTFAYYMKILK